MTCDERKELLIAYAADALSEAEQQEMRAHLATGCARCNAELVEAQKLLEQIPATIDPVAPPAEAVTKLMKRITTVPVQPPAILRFTWRAVAMAACVGIIIGSAALYFYEQSDRERLMVAFENQKSQLADLRSMFESQQLKLVALSSPDQSATGRVLWDRDNNKWHVVVFNLKPMTGREYELWFIKPDQTKVRAGMVKTDAAGRGTAVVDVPMNIGDVAVAAITDEPPGGVDQPTGSVRLAGQVQ